MRPIFCLVGLLIWNTAGSLLAEEWPPFRLTPQTEIRFAAGEEAQAAITRSDDFTKSLSRFDLQARLKTDKDVTTDDLLKLYTDNVTPWPREDVENVTKGLEVLRERIADFQIPHPETILLIRTTGKEESGAAYCRGPAIVLPENMLRQSPKGLLRLLAHELFHVISTQNPELRRELYEIIGFRMCNPIALPATLRDSVITNPDAPQLDAYIELTLADGQKVAATPLLLASPAKYEPEGSKSFFDYMDFKLLQVEKRGDRWEAVLKDDQPVLLEPRGLKSYAEQIGKNTGYVIHPDEILADNFALMIIQSDKLPTPEIVEKIKAVLKK